MAGNATELQNKLGTLKRYGTTVGGTALFIMATLQWLTPAQIAELKAQADILNQSIVTGYGALTKMWLIAGPLAVGIAMKMGWNSSSMQALGSKLLKMATNDVPAAPPPIAGGFESLPPPSPQLDIAKAQAAIASATSAKDVLIAATIGLPSVQTIVADKTTADAAVSESVVAADVVKVVPAK